MPLTSPALRQDLEIRPVHRNGRRFIELADRSTGIRLWLSELGYSVAFLLDGSDLDVVVARAREALHFELTRARAGRFAERLAGFGLLVDTAGDPAIVGPTAASPRVAALSPAGAATLADPPAAAVAAAAVVPPAVPAAPARDADTLALSPHELDMILQDARDRGDAGTPIARIAPRPAGHRRTRTAHGRTAYREDARSTLLGVAARRDRVTPVPHVSRPRRHS